MTGRIIILNGASSSGKTSIARALQAIWRGPLLHLGIDTAIGLLPFAYTGDGAHAADGYRLAPDSDEDGPVTRYTPGPLGRRLNRHLASFAARLAADGLDAVLDHVIVDDATIVELARILDTSRTHLIGVTCDPVILSERERRRGDRAVASRAIRSRGPCRVAAVRSDGGHDRGHTGGAGARRHGGGAWPGAGRAGRHHPRDPLIWIKSRATRGIFPAGAGSIDPWGRSPRTTYRRLSMSHSNNQSDDTPLATSKRSEAAAELASQVPEGKGSSAIGRSITIARPVGEVFAYFRDFANLSTFMENVERIDVLDAKRSHWVVKAPAGAKVEWDARVTDEQQDRLIAWTSEDGADVPNSGRVEFRDAGPRGTIVHALILYDPPGGIIGKVIAKMFQREPNMQARQDLKRFKQLMETGEVTTRARNQREYAEEKN